MAHLRVWKFRPAEGSESAFEAAYGRVGTWARLFQRAEGFEGTTLLRPAGTGGWWLTLDRWRSRDCFEAFQRDHGSDYRALDAQLNELVGEQEFVGAFEDFG